MSTLVASQDYIKTQAVNAASSPSVWSSLTGRPLVRNLLIVGVGVAGAGVLYWFFTRRIKVSHDNTYSPVPTMNRRRSSVRSEQEIASAMILANISSQEQISLTEALRWLTEDDESHIVLGLKQIADKIQSDNTHRVAGVVIDCGGLEAMIELLAQKNDNTEMNRYALKILHHMFSVESVRNSDAITERTIEHIAYYLTSDDDELKEAAIHALMNLSVETKNEDRVRDAGALIPCIDIFLSERSTNAVRLFALRLLVNLVYNQTNKGIMLEQGVLSKVKEMIIANPTEDVASRLIRLLGHFALNADASTYAEVADTNLAVVIVKLLQKYRNGDQLTEAAAVAISRLTQQSNDVNKEEILSDFKDALMEYNNGVVVELLVAMLNTKMRYNALCALANLTHGHPASAERVHALEGAVDSIRSLCTSPQPRVKERASEVLQNLEEFAANREETQEVY